MRRRVPELRCRIFPAEARGWQALPARRASRIQPSTATVLMPDPYERYHADLASADGMPDSPHDPGPAPAEPHAVEESPGD